MYWLLWLVLPLGLYALVAAGYRLFLSVKKLGGEVQVARGQLEAFEPDQLEIAPAEPTRQQDLFKLLSQRRQRRRQKQRDQEDRRRRLISRISSINVDKRGAHED